LSRVDPSDLIPVRIGRVRHPVKSNQQPLGCAEPAILEKRLE